MGKFKVPSRPEEPQKVVVVSEVKTTPDSRELFCRLFQPLSGENQRSALSMPTALSYLSIPYPLSACSTLARTCAGRHLSVLAGARPNLPSLLSSIGFARFVGLLLVGG